MEDTPKMYQDKQLLLKNFKNKLLLIRPVAQLIRALHLRREEVVGANPIGPTKLFIQLIFST
jgi:hypothetical protein